MACSNCANPFEYITESTETCSCGSVNGTIPSGTPQQSEEGGCCVESVNGMTGIVVLTISDIDLEGNQFFTTALVWASLSAEDPIDFDSGLGLISHKNSGVSGGTYGDATHIPVITVNAKGHITSITTQSITTALSSNLQNLDALVGTGYLVKTASNTWVFRTLQGASGRIALTQANGVAGNTTIDLQSGIIGAGTYGNSTQYPIITVDTYGRVVAISLQTVAGGVGDNWGSQVVQHDTTLGGNGTSGTPLKIAQQGAAPGQCLKWNGSSWVPGDYTMAIGEFLIGTGISLNPLEVNRITKVQDALYGSGGYTAGVIHTFVLTGWNTSYGTAVPTTDLAILVRFIFRIEIITMVAVSGYITISFHGAILYKLLLVIVDHGGVIVGEALVDQSITTMSKVFVRGETCVADANYNITSCLPTSYLISPASFTNPTLGITCDTGITARVGVTYEIDKKQSGKYVAQ